MIHNYNNTLHLIVAIPEAASKGRKGQKNVFSQPFPQEAEVTANARSRRREKRLMEEIDDLYSYVRDGGAVPDKVISGYLFSFFDTFLNPDPDYLNSAE